MGKIAISKSSVNSGIFTFSCINGSISSIKELYKPAPDYKYVLQNELFNTEKAHNPNIWRRRSNLHNISLKAVTS